MQITHDADDARIGRCVRQLRSVRGILQAELSDAMVKRGWTSWRQSTVSAVESGQRPVRLAEADDLAGVLGVGIEQLLYDAIDRRLAQIALRQMTNEDAAQTAAREAFTLAREGAVLESVQSARKGATPLLAPEFYPLDRAFGEVFFRLDRTEFAEILLLAGLPDREVVGLSAIHGDARGRDVRRVLLDEIAIDDDEHIPAFGSEVFDALATVLPALESLRGA